MNLEEIKAVVSKAEEAARELESYKERVVNLEGVVRRYDGKVANLKRLLGEFIKEETVEQDIVEQIAEVFDINLTKTIEGTVTVTWSFSVEVGLDDSVDDLDFSAELVANGADDCDISEETFDVEED